MLWLAALLIACSTSDDSASEEQLDKIEQLVLDDIEVGNTLLDICPPLLCPEPDPCPEPIDADWPDGCYPAPLACGEGAVAWWCPSGWTGENPETVPSGPVIVIEGAGDPGPAGFTCAGADDCGQGIANAHEWCRDSWIPSQE